MMRPDIATLRASDMAIDVGTAAVRVAAGSQLVRERRSASGEHKALAGGVVVDTDAAVEVLRPILRQARRWMGFSRIRALACAPTDATAEEKAALTECITRVGASAVYISSESLAAAIGAGIDVASPYARLIVDIGEGVTDCAVIRSAQVIASHAIRIGCADLRARLRQHALQHHRLDVSDDEAECVLRVFGTGDGAPAKTIMSGSRDGCLCALPVNSEKLRASLARVKDAILGCVETLLRDLPPALSAEVIEDGIWLSGGGALLRGMCEQVARVTHVDVRVVADPLHTVVSGARAMLPAAATLRLWKD
jgi:rod shape-determining protein MreB and related proteins